MCGKFVKGRGAVCTLLYIHGFEAAATRRLDIVQGARQDDLDSDKTDCRSCRAHRKVSHILYGLPRTCDGAHLFDILPLRLDLLPPPAPVLDLDDRRAPDARLHSRPARLTPSSDPLLCCPFLLSLLPTREVLHAQYERVHNHRFIDAGRGPAWRGRCCAAAAAAPAGPEAHVHGAHARPVE